MKRFVLATAAAAVALGAALASAGCEPMVRVETGTRVVCTYDHVVSDDVKTIEVPASAASSYRVRTVTETCERHLALEKLYKEAQAALAAGNLVDAKAKLAKIAESDPAFKQTPQQLAALERGEKPAPDSGGASGGSSTPTQTPKPGEGDTSGPIGSLERYAPEVLGTYKGGKALTDAFTLTREYTPESDRDVLTLVIVAEQMQSAAAAKNAVETHMNSAYTHDEDTRRAGARTVRFGTDDRRFASVAFAQGSVFVVLEMAAQDGVDPKSLESEIIDVTALLP